MHNGQVGQKRAVTQTSLKSLFHSNFTPIQFPIFFLFEIFIVNISNYKLFESIWAI